MESCYVSYTNAFSATKKTLFHLYWTGSYIENYKPRKTLGVIKGEGFSKLK
jgi:hypothetical protein